MIYEFNFINYVKYNKNLHRKKFGKDVIEIERLKNLSEIINNYVKMLIKLGKSLDSKQHWKAIYVTF